MINLDNIQRSAIETSLKMEEKAKDISYSDTTRLTFASQSLAFSIFAEELSKYGVNS